MHSASLARNHCLNIVNFHDKNRKSENFILPAVPGIKSRRPNDPASPPGRANRRPEKQNPCSGEAHCRPEKQNCRQNYDLKWIRNVFVCRAAQKRRNHKKSTKRMIKHSGCFRFQLATTVTPYICLVKREMVNLNKCQNILTNTLDIHHTFW